MTDLTDLNADKYQAVSARKHWGTTVPFNEIFLLVHCKPQITKGAFWRPTDQDQVLTTWSEGRQNGLVLNSWLCDVTAQSSKSDINIQ